MNFSSLVCKVLGHQPQEYSYEERRTTTTYTECSRCCKRKNIYGYGWVTPEEDGEN